MSDLVKRLRAAGRHPMMDNYCKVDVFDVNDAGGGIEELEAERDAVAARLERALVLGAENRARADRLSARIAELEVERDMLAAELDPAVSFLELHRHSANVAEARADSLAAMLKEAEEALRLILPLAKGYAATNRHEINARCVRIAEDVRARLEAREVSDSITVVEKAVPDSPLYQVVRRSPHD
jgi:outer membrane murein-binding lipoprotein Lpp